VMQQHLAQYRQAQDAKLMQVRPDLKDDAKRKVFDDSIRKTALSFGFTEQDLSGPFDHRLLLMVEKAAIGVAAENARAAVRRKQAAKPSKGRRPRRGVAPKGKGQEARQAYASNPTASTAHALIDSMEL